MNQRTRGATRVGEISKKVHGLVMRRDEECLGERVMEMDVEG